MHRLLGKTEETLLAWLILAALAAVLYELTHNLFRLANVPVIIISRKELATKCFVLMLVLLYVVIALASWL